MKNISFNIVVWQEEQYFVAQCLNTNVSSFGDTKEEALENINEALELYFEESDSIKLKYIKINEPELVKSTLAYA